MSKRDDIVAEARSWIETPFLHLGRSKGLGVDCIGLVICVARAVDFYVVDTEWYPPQPIYGFFEQAVDGQTEPVGLADVLPGDLLKFKYGRGNQQHIGIVTEIGDRPRFIHSYAVIGKTEETDFERSWQARFTGARRYRELA